SASDNWVKIAASFDLTMAYAKCAGRAEFAAYLGRKSRRCNARRPEMNEALPRGSVRIADHALDFIERVVLSGDRKQRRRLCEIGGVHRRIDLGRHRDRLAVG